MCRIEGTVPFIKYVARYTGSALLGALSPRALIQGTWLNQIKAFLACNYRITPLCYFSCVTLSVLPPSQVSFMSQSASRIMKR